MVGAGEGGMIGSEAEGMVGAVGGMVAGPGAAVGVAGAVMVEEGAGWGR